MYDFSELDRYLGTITKQGFATSCDVAVTRNHQRLHRYLHGFLDKEGTSPVREDSLYYLFSCSKPVTVTAGMMLVEQERMSLGDPVSRYLPEFAHAYTLKNGVRTEVGDQLLVRHLFTMSSGLDYDAGRTFGDLSPEQREAASTREIVAQMTKLPLLFFPGERFQYGLSHDVLAAVIEVVSGMSFGEYLKKSIFEPLHMEHTFFAHPHSALCQEPDPSRSNLARLYSFNGRELEPMTNALLYSEAYESGGAGLISCLDDYAAFGDMLACEGVAADGTRLLREETVRLMYTDQLHSFVRDPAFSCPCGSGYSYGLGLRVLVDRSTGQRPPLGEFGWDGAVGAYLLCDPVDRLSLIHLQSAGGWPEPLQGHLPMRDLIYDALGL